MIKHHQGKSRKGYVPFSPIWREIFQTRFALCVCICIFALNNTNRALLIVFAVMYVLLLTLMGLINDRTLQLKKMRFIPAFVDIIFISLIVFYSGGTGSSWYLIYLFPIISVSRYLGYLGSLFIASEATIAYLCIYLLEVPAQDLAPSVFILRCLSFLGIAFVAGNLSEKRRRDEARLIKTFTEIDNAMLSDMEPRKVFNLILNKGLELTASEMGHIRLIDSKTQEAVEIAAVGQPKHHSWELRHLDEGISHKVIASKEPLIIQAITKSHLVKYLGTYFRLHKPRPRSAIFVPIMFGDIVKGVIAVYSRQRFHYTRRDQDRLESLSSLSAMAQKNADLLKEQQERLLRLSEAEARLKEELTLNEELLKEQQERLKLLYKIGERLKGDLDLDALFNEVVDLTYNQLDPEEAALFVVGDGDGETINKVAVKGPTKEVTDRLASIELSYRVGESLVGDIFKTRTHKLLSSVPPDVEYVDKYRPVLPSQKICHYIGVPLLRGKEILGVIRAINKRGADYSPERHEHALSDHGFDNDDLQLMQTIASQVAVAIQNAKLLEKYGEAKKYYESLVINSPDPIIVLDNKGNIKDFNKACEKVWGYTREEVEGKPVVDYCESARHVKEISRALWAAKADGYRIRNYGTKIRHSDGETLIPISLSVSLLHNEDGKLIAAIGVFKDLRELLLLKERIIESEKMADFDTVVRTVGHDIKHRIGVILSNTKLLLSGPDKVKQSELMEMYTEIKDSAQDSIDTIQYMLMATKPKPPQKKVACVEDIFRNIEDRMKRQISNLGKFSISFPEADHDIFVDIEQMKQVFWNLYNNSLDSIKERRALDQNFAGHIKVSAEVNCDHLLLAWEDDGMGIRAEDLPHIFEAFYTMKQGGSGLGLYISKSIIEVHEGRVAVESKYGEGTCFTITLPLWEGEKITEQ
ncbi:MAG: hypothetical protein AUG51_09195 [Acidobacteria bacterium 13_1_20CM_3_53_8]|nr:MAG: hypothetical protein AUG51_09195 [Acidobacteria bacterium 13_1_20CM_3_53_8]